MPEARPLPGWPAALDEDMAAAYVSLSGPSLRRLVDAGDAPKPIRLTPKRIAWRRADLDAWLARRGETALPSEDIFASG